MGIKFFQRFFYNQYQETIIENINFEIQTLYFDYNSLLHTFVANTNEDDTEDIIIDNIINKTVDEIEKIKPTKKVYFAFDGPCPLGKIFETRKRRYDTFQEQLKNPDKPFFDTLKLSPGTIFMKNVKNQLKTGIQKNLMI